MCRQPSRLPPASRRRRQRGRVVALCLIVIVSAAGTNAAAAAVESEESILAALHDEERTERRTIGLWRARISHPLRVSAGIGLLSARVPVGYDCRTVCRMSGWVAALEPGLAGVQLAAGYGTVFGEQGPRRRMIERAYLGYGVRAALLRTSADASLRPARQTLLGVEGQFTVIHVNISLGAFRNISGGAPDDRWIVSGGLGFGF